MKEEQHVLSSQLWAFYNQGGVRLDTVSGKASVCDNV